MKLHIKRSQATTGVMTKTVMFQLNVRVALTEEERHHVQKYKLGGEVLYSSERRQQHAQNARSGGLLRGALSAAMASLSLVITINSLLEGQTIQYKSLEEIIAAEEAVREGCESMKEYIAAASLFNGEETVVEY